MTDNLNEGHQAQVAHTERTSGETQIAAEQQASGAEGEITAKKLIHAIGKRAQARGRDALAALYRMHSDFSMPQNQEINEATSLMHALDEAELNAVGQLVALSAQEGERPAALVPPLTGTDSEIATGENLPRSAKDGSGTKTEAQKPLLRDIYEISEFEQFIDQNLPAGLDPLAKIDTPNRTMRFLRPGDEDGRPGDWQNGVELIKYNTNKPTVSYGEYSGGDTTSSEGEAYKGNVKISVENYYEVRDPKRGVMETESLLICDDGIVLVRVGDRIKGRWTTSIRKATQEDIDLAIGKVNEQIQIELDNLPRRPLHDDDGRRREPEPESLLPPTEPKDESDEIETVQSEPVPQHSIPAQRTELEDEQIAAIVRSEDDRQLHNIPTTSAIEPVQAPPRGRLRRIGRRIARTAAAGTLLAGIVPAPTYEAATAAVNPHHVAADAEVTHTTSTERGLKVLEEYAREFSADPDAGKIIFPHDLRKVADMVGLLKKEGFETSRITIRGSSSGENESSDKNAGLDLPVTTPDQVPNVHLSDLREDSFQEMVEKEFADLHIQGIDLQLLPAQVDVLKEKQLKKLTRIAKKFGFTTLAAAVDAYNFNHEDFPAGALPAFDSVLRDERDVMLEFYAEKTTETPLTIPMKASSQIFNYDSLHVPVLAAYIPNEQGRPERVRKRIFTRNNKALQSRTPGVPHRYIQPNWYTNANDQRGQPRGRGGSRFRNSNPDSGKK